jgi:hypothetical protein
MKNTELVSSEVLALSINQIAKTDSANELGLFLELTKAK